MNVRPAQRTDAAAIAAIYNAGIEERSATFETRLRFADEIADWIGGRFPIEVVATEDGIVAFAASSKYRDRDCYAGIAEFSVYTAANCRGQGYGRAAMEALMESCRAAGFHKLVSRIFVENSASRTLMASLGFREVGIYEAHGILDGVWRDVVIVEKQLL